jgi:cytochrome c-type biogenesis protein CcmF
VVWIWGGCLLMAMGGVLAISDRRYRIHSRKAARISAGSLPVGGSIATGGAS